MSTRESCLWDGCGFIISFVQAYIAGQPFNASAAEAALAAQIQSISQLTSLPPQDLRTSEDCLFQDAIVPQEVFGQPRKAAVPVPVWIWGDANIAGDKTIGGFNPAGFFNASRVTVSKEFIFVTLNYWVRHILTFGTSVY